MMSVLLVATRAMLPRAALRSVKTAPPINTIHLQTLPTPQHHTRAPLTTVSALFCDYERGDDAGDDVDVAQVEDMIAQRTQLRKKGDFSGADALRDELRDMGVALWDRERLWTVGSAAPPPRNDRRGRGREDRGGGRRQFERRGEPEFRSNHQGTRVFVENLSFDTQWQELKDHFVNAGFPTVYASVSYDRMAGRSKGHGFVQFETVHSAESAIEQMTGTELDGRTINCRPDYKDAAGGGPPRDRWGPPGESRPRGPRMRQLNEHGHDYERHEEDTATLDAEQLERVNDLLRLRLEAKLERNFDVADAHLASLREEFNVDVNDGGKAWRADGKSFERLFKREVDCTAPVDVTAVEELLQRRSQARKERQYQTADAILDELYETHGVDVNDRERRWRVARE